MRTHRHIITVAILSLAASCSPGDRAGAQPRAGAIEWTPISFETREGKHQKVQADRGRLWVRERWADPTSRLIGLGMVRFRSTAPHPGPPVVYLAGGPGGSGTRSAAGDRFPLFMALREVGDVIAMDQRGVLSEPMPACREKIGYPLDRPMERDAWLALLRERCQDCVSAWKQQGIDLAAFQTDASADDLEALRLALGVPKIDLWAISYGTHLAIAMMKRHGDGVGKAILAGVEGPDHTLKLPSSFERHIARLDSLIGLDPAARAAVPSLRGLLRETIARLEAAPARVSIRDPRTRQPIDVVLGPLDFKIAVVENISERHDIQSLPVLARAIAGGDLSSVAQVALSGRTASVGLAMSYTMDCASGASAERLDRIRGESGTLLGDAINLPFPDICDAWPHEDPGPAFREPLRSEIPVLCISGTLDVRTPPENAEEVLATLPNGRPLVIEGAGHDDDLFLSSPEILQAMLRFLRGEPTAGRIVLPPIRFERAP